MYLVLYFSCTVSVKDKNTDDRNKRPVMTNFEFDVQKNTKIFYLTGIIKWDVNIVSIVKL